MLFPLLQEADALEFLGIHDLHEICGVSEGSHEGRQQVVFIEET